MLQPSANRQWHGGLTSAPSLHARRLTPTRHLGSIAVFGTGTVKPLSGISTFTIRRPVWTGEALDYRSGIP